MTRSWFARPITFVNGCVVSADGVVGTTIRIAGAKVDGIDVAPDRGDEVIDLDGAVVLPGLVNAHDHLELNTVPRLKWRNRHTNVREWIADFQPRFATDPHLRVLTPDTLDDRLWVGGLKNLLSGVTTVCHHNPLHRALHRRFPVKIVRRFGFSHSLLVDGDGVAAVHHATPEGQPWIIHAGEGVDVDAQAEIPALHRMGCLDGRTVVVHGVAACHETAALMIAAGAGLVWCPSSNDWLFGATADVRPFDDADLLALGSDSRLSAAGDLLDEVRAAYATRQVSPQSLVRLVTTGAASLLKLPDAGGLAPRGPADLVVLSNRGGDPRESLIDARRTDVALVMIDGAPAVAVPAFAPAFAASGMGSRAAIVDGSPRLVAQWIARRTAALAVPETGFEVDAA